MINRIQKTESDKNSNRDQLQKNEKHNSNQHKEQKPNKDHRSNNHKDNRQHNNRDRNQNQIEIINNKTAIKIRNRFKEPDFEFDAIIERKVFWSILCRWVRIFKIL